LIGHARLKYLITASIFIAHPFLALLFHAGQAGLGQSGLFIERAPCDAILNRRPIKAGRLFGEYKEP
jgi:hypothetical protein